MKKVKKMIAMICAVVTILSCFAMFASAASISRNKHTATGIRGGQSVYITSNNGWNTELFGNTYRTKIQITLPSSYREYYQINGFNQSGRLTNGKKVQVTIYKKSGRNWVEQNDLSGKFACDGFSGVLGYQDSVLGLWHDKTFVLSGKGVQYKVVVTPEYHELLGLSASQMSGIKVTITSYGLITSVS